MPAHLPEKTPIDALAAMASPTAPTLLDIRLPEDQDGHHIPGALQIGYEQASAHQHLCPNGAIVICHKGLKLSAGITARLRAAGLPAWRLAGGHLGWIAAGLPVTKDLAPTRVALALEATVHEALATWAWARFSAPRGELLEVPRADLDGVLARFDANPPPPLPDLPSLERLAAGSGLAQLALHDAAPTAVFPTFDLAFRGALRQDFPTQEAPA